MIEHYLDNSATTRVSDTVAQTMLQMLTQNYGNPSSLHSKGIQSEIQLENAREIISNSLDVHSGEIFFTSGGTESNNTAIFGIAKALSKQGNRIVTTSIEHSSVIESMRILEKSGFEVVYLTPDKFGNISFDSIEDAINDKTILVSMMAVNNETGLILPINSVSNIIKRKKSRAIFHIDAVQAYGKIKLSAPKLGADLISISSHKIHGPKGTGALYVKKGTKITPLLYGGEQEKKIRPGTQAVHNIVGFGEAVSEFNIISNLEKVQTLNSYLRDRISRIDGIVINSTDNSLPYILNISVIGIRSETMLHFLAQRGVYVSSGSACAKGGPSYVLNALGLDKNLADSAIRISFSKYSTIEDIDALVDGIQEGLNTLVRRK